MRTIVLNNNQKIALSNHAAALLFELLEANREFLENEFRPPRTLVRRTICFQSTTTPTKCPVDAQIASSPLLKQLIQCTSASEPTNQRLILRRRRSPGLLLERERFLASAADMRIRPS